MISDSGKSAEPITMDLMLRVAALRGSGLLQAAIRHRIARHTATGATTIRIRPRIHTVLTVTSQLRGVVVHGSRAARFPPLFGFFIPRMGEDNTMSSNTPASATPDIPPTPPKA